MWLVRGSKPSTEAQVDKGEEQTQLVSTSQAETSEFTNAAFSTVDHEKIWEEQSAPLQLKAEVSDLDRAEIAVQYMGKSGVDAVIVSLFASWSDLYQLLLAASPIETAHLDKQASVDIGAKKLLLYQTPLVKGTLMGDTFTIEIAKHRENEEERQKRRFSLRQRLTKACNQRDEDPEKHTERISEVFRRFDITGEGVIWRCQWDEVMQYTKPVNNWVGDEMSWYRRSDGSQGLWIEGVALDEGITLEQMECVLWKFPGSNLFEILDILEPQEYSKGGTEIAPKMFRSAIFVKNKAAPGSRRPVATTKSKAAPSSARPGAAIKAKAKSPLPPKMATESTAASSSPAQTRLPKQGKAKGAQPLKLAPPSNESREPPKSTVEVDGMLRKSVGLIKKNGRLRKGLKEEEEEAEPVQEVPTAPKTQTKKVGVLRLGAKAAAKVVGDIKYNFGGQVESV